MTQSDTQKIQLGNTNNELNNEDKINNRGHRAICFTWNNYNDTDDINILIEWLTEKKAKYVFQEETGANGTKHLQGYFETKNAIRFDTLKKFNKNIHWEKCRDKKKSIAYCQKSESRTGKVYIHGLKKIVEIKDPLKGKELYEWQKNILDLIKTEPDERKIYWYWEADGNKGKSSLVKHILLNYNAICVDGKGNDILHGVASWIEENDSIDIVLIDLARTREGYVSYEAIEKIKNGFFFSGKYESKQIIFNIPHLIIMANFQPDRTKLSLDRWLIENI